MTKIDNDKMHAIALYKINNPDKTIQEISDKFDIKPYQARYAIDKYAENSEFLKGNKKGRTILAKVTASNEEDIELMKNQLNLILGELTNNDNMAVASRTTLLGQCTKIKMFIQTAELESHVKRADAAIIAAIIRRFHPEASNDEVIKIYNEELLKLRQKKIKVKKGS